MSPRWSALSAVVIALAVGAAPAAAQDAEELIRRAATVATRVDGADPETARSLLGELGSLAVAFIRQAEAAHLAGGRNREELRRAYDAIATPFDRLHRRFEERMEAGEQAIIAEDGDLEAYYDSAAYQDAQHVSANARYYLNWLRYYGATLHEGDRRLALLRQAREGFSAFTLGDPNSELVVESVLGRGLCALDLGDLRAAVADLNSVSRSAAASPERKRRAQLSLLEAHVQAGDVQAALRQSEELLAAGDAEEGNWIRFMRLRALLDGSKRGGSEVAAWRTEAVALMDRLRRAGGAWEQRITAVAQEAFADTAAWSASAQAPFARWELARHFVQRQDYASAAPLLEEVIASTDRSLAKHQPQARYLLGLAHFHAGDHAAALEQLEQATGLEAAADRADRAYLIFKAIEALAVAAGEDADVAPLAAAASSFLEEFPDHAAAFEARFRLAEMAQRDGDFARAIELYAEVAGDPSVELQAAFAQAQCRFEQLRLGGSDEDRAAILTAIGSDLDAVAAARSTHGDRIDANLHEGIGAKAAIMRAVWHRLATPPDPAGIAAALDGFEASHPNHEELFPQVVRMRLEAWRDAGTFEPAVGEAESNAALLFADLGPAATEELASSFIRAGARRAGQGDRGASDDAQRVAAALYAVLAAEPGTGARTKLTLARLRENAGHIDAAEALYEEIVAEGTVSTTALRGLARIAEARGQSDEALVRWERLGAAVQPGDLPWFESHYERARVLVERGDAGEACRLLSGLRAAMPGLQDADLRERLNELRGRACG